MVTATKTSRPKKSTAAAVPKRARTAEPDTTQARVTKKRKVDPESKAETTVKKSAAAAKPKTKAKAKKATATKSAKEANGSAPAKKPKVKTEKKPTEAKKEPTKAKKATSTTTTTKAKSAAKDTKKAAKPKDEKNTTAKKATATKKAKTSVKAEEEKSKSKAKKQKKVEEKAPPKKKKKVAKAKKAPVAPKEPKPRPIVFPKRKVRHEVNKPVQRETEAGTVFVFGSGDCGQLGLTDDVYERKKPAAVPAIKDTKIVDIASGGLHNLVITDDGKLWSWGCNDQKTLGRSGEEFEAELVKDGLENIKISKVACCDSASAVLTDDGYVYACGTFRSSEGIMGFSPEVFVQDKLTLMTDLLNETVVDIVAGADHFMALTVEGEVYTWGNGQQSQLGRRIIERRRNDGLRPAKLSLINIVSIGAGSYHSFAIDKDGTLFSWGLNNFFQCGLNALDGGEDPMIAEPTEVAALKGIPIAKVSGGEHHSLALSRAGDIYAFGRSDSYQSGLEFHTIPVNKLPESERKRESVLAATNGGENNESQHKKTIILPTKLESLSNVVQISCGSNHNLALTKDNKIFSWGYGEMNQLGNGAEEDEKTPYHVMGKQIEGRRVLKVSAGGQHSVLLCA